MIAYPLLLTAALCAPFVPTRAAIAPAAMLRAIAAVESGGDNAARGPRGERSAWQFVPATWRRYTDQPFTLASSDCALAYAVAGCHLEWILRHLGRGIQPEIVACAWNPGAPRDYSQRVANLYRVYCAEIPNPKTP